MEILYWLVLISLERGQTKRINESHRCKQSFIFSGLVRETGAVQHATTFRLCVELA